MIIINKKFLLVLIIFSVALTILPISASEDIGVTDDYLSSDYGNSLNEIDGIANDVVIDEMPLLKDSNQSSIEQVEEVETSLVSDDVNIIKGNDFHVKLVDGNNAGISNKSVEIIVNGKSYYRVTDEDGIAALQINLAEKNYDINCKFQSDGYKTSSVSKKVLVISTSTSKITASDVTIYRTFGGDFKATLTVGGKPLVSRKVSITVNGKTYAKTTNAKGQVSLAIGLAAKTYTVKVAYAGEQNINPASVSSKIIVKNPIKTSLKRVDADINYRQGSVAPFYIKLADGSGNALKSKTVKFTVNKVTYTRKTDSSGQATLSIGLKKGTYTISYSFATSKPYLSSKGSAKITIKEPIKGNGGIWIFGGSMKSVKLSTLSNAGIKNIFLNAYAFDLYGKTAVLNWIKQANSNGLKVHIWMQVFYNGGWVVPVNSDGSYKYTLMNSKIKDAKYYAGLSGVAGVHLDYLRFGGTAHKHKNAAASINYFVKKCVSEVHKVKSNAIVSAAIMPEPNSNKQYYGQDIPTISKYLDVLVPMIYKGNYHASTNWIKTTTAAFVKMSNGAKVWTGLQCYKSDADVTKLSYSQLYNDAKAAKNGGASGVVLFRFGLTQFIDCNKLFK